MKLYRALLGVITFATLSAETPQNFYEKHIQPDLKLLGESLQEGALPGFIEGIALCGIYKATSSITELSLGKTYISTAAGCAVAGGSLPLIEKRIQDMQYPDNGEALQEKKRELLDTSFFSLTRDEAEVVASFYALRGLGILVGACTTHYAIEGILKLFTNPVR